VIRSNVQALFDLEAREVFVPTAPHLDPRIPSWAPHLLVRRSCPLCGSSDARGIVRRPDGLVVAGCMTCGMSYLPLIPGKEQLASFYSSYSNTHQQRPLDAERARRAAKRRRGGNDLLNRIARLRPLRGCRLLELGCSTGGFLLDARLAGADVSGMEVDARAREFLQTELRIPCHGKMAEVEAHKPYDIVVALNLIEHLPSPREWIEQVARALTPGGLLVIWTPNGGEADALGPSWVGFRVDFDHVNYFSPATLSALLREVDLWPEGIFTFNQPDLTSCHRGTHPHSDGIAAAFLRRFTRFRSRSWALPPQGGSYTLCAFAGKA
jgi:SAM-dependent methyltransferase